MPEAERDLLARDYELVRRHGGNAEPVTKRADGVSFNPRLGRILSILIQDGRIQDIATLRAAWYGATTLPESELESVVPSELRELVCQARALPAVSDMARAIRLAWALDTVRHLHMSVLSLAERSDLLQQHVEPSLLLDAPEHLEPLVVKLRHAITLQQRKIDFDSNPEGFTGEAK
jgi:hypothetical protein